MSAVSWRREDRVGRVLLDRPQARNAITVELATGLEQAVTELSGTVDVIVVRGAGGTFCAGGDVTELNALRARGRDATATLFTAFRAALRAIESAPVPVVAVVEGHAVAGGFELVQAVDVAIVSDDARLADIHARYGQVPGGGSTQRLPRLLGRARAMGLILTGDTLTGREAAALGLVYRSVPQEDLDRATEQLLASLLTGSTDARRASKRLVRAAEHLSLDDGLDAELTAVLDHLSGAAGDAAEAAFTSRERTDDRS